MLSDGNLFCRVCGYRSEEPTWGDDGQTPSFEFCPCCGVQHGYEDATDIAVKNFRKKWIAAGAKWDDIGSKQEDWSLETQLQNVPESFKS
jgi:hypothetical protein